MRYRAGSAARWAASVIDPGGAGTAIAGSAIPSGRNRRLREKTSIGDTPRNQMRTETLNETMSLDEINRALDLARERDPSIEPEPGYSDASRANSQLSAGDHASNLSILAAAAFMKGHAPETRSVSRLSFTKMSWSWLANIDASMKASLFTNQSRGRKPLRPQNIKESRSASRE